MKRTRKILSCLLCLCMVLSVMPINVFAARFYNTGSCGALLNDGVLTISGEGSTGDHNNYIPQPWLTQIDSIHTVIINDDVTGIGNNTFKYMRALKNVTIGKNVTDFGANAFLGCENLENIYWNATSVEDLSEKNTIFSECGSSNGITVTFGENVEYIPANLFWASTVPKIKKVVFNGPVEIGYNAFALCGKVDVHISSVEDWCQSTFKSTDSNPLIAGSSLYLNGTILKDLKTSNNLSEINEMAFIGCTSIETVTIKDGLTKIGEFAFCDCSNLKKVYLPKSLKTIERCVFDIGTGKKLDIYYAGTEEEWNKINKDQYYIDSYVNLTMHYNEIYEKKDFEGITLENKEFTYDGTEKELLVTGNLPSGTTIEYSNNKAIDVGTYDVSATVKALGYYDLTLNATLKINPKAISVTGLTAINKEYDATNEAVLSGGTISGLAARDAADQYCDEHQEYRIKYYIPETGVFADANVGNNKAVSIAEIELTGCSADNYILTQPTGLKANITKAPLTVKANDKQIRIGDAIPSFDYVIENGQLFGEDKFEGTLTSNCSSTAIAKDYIISQGTLTAGSNYELTFVEGKLMVVDKTPQNIIVDGVVTEKTYGEDGFKITVTPDETSKLDNFTMTSSNSEVASIDESGNVTIKNAGTTTISVKEAGNDEYAPFEKTWTLTVNKVKITITADNLFKKIGQEDPEFTYVLNGTLIGEDEVIGKLSRTSGEEIGKYDIVIGTLAINNNYEITFNKGVFEILDKTPQVITVAEVDAKTYGDDAFKLEVTADETSKLDTFTYTSSNIDVADVAADGTVTINGAGETTITVSQAGNDEYAATEKSVKVIVNPITVAVTAIDMGNKTATIEGILDADKDSVELDFDNVKTTVISSEKSTVEETTTITSTLKVTNFTFKGEKAKNYVADKTASLTTTVATTTVVEKLTEDENVTIEAAPVDDKTIIVTDVAVAPESEVKKVTIDVTAIADTKVNTVALPKTTVDTIIGIDAEASLEITLKDGSAENKESTITLNAQALAAIQTAGSASTTLSISVNKTEKEELATEQAAKFDEVSTKTPVVYSLSIVDEAGNSVASSFGDAGKATVTLPYAKPAGNGNVIVKYLDDLGNLTNISNPKYDAATQTVTVELAHFSEYLIYTEPVRSSGGGGGVSKYTVKFETNGGTAIKSVSVNKNAVATEPTAPTKEGFKFDGWYTDKELTTAYDFTAKVTKNFTLYAKWTEIEKEPVVDEPDTTITFTDVKKNDWFYANVQYVVENNLMNGVAEDKFAPNDTLTRAMLVTVLYRNAGEPSVNKSIPFADVDMDSWYANAVIWAKQNGIVNGVNDTEFAPDANITREQIATIMFRYAQYKGMDAVTLEDNLHFTDADEISEFAVSAMNWAVGTGLMNGKSATTLNPKDNATRAEIAAILQRFIETNK